jgi:hypothetical protein
MSEERNSTHYALLSKHHAAAAEASRKLEIAIVKRSEADQEIKEAHRQLTNVHELISKWYQESP